MNTVILIANQAVTIQELFVKLRALWPKTYTNPLGGFVVEDGDHHVYVDLETPASEEYEPEHLEKITKLMPSPRFFYIDYSGSEFIKRVLLGIADDPRIVVDNDAGTVLPGPAFVKKLREEPWWDWFEEWRRDRGKESGSDPS